MMPFSMTVFHGKVINMVLPCRSKQSKHIILTTTLRGMFNDCVPCTVLVFHFILSNFIDHMFLVHQNNSASFQRVFPSRIFLISTFLYPQPSVHKIVLKPSNYISILLYLIKARTSITQSKKEYAYNQSSARTSAVLPDMGQTEKERGQSHEWALMFMLPL